MRILWPVKPMKKAPPANPDPPLRNFVRRFPSTLRDLRAARASVVPRASRCLLTKSSAFGLSLAGTEGPASPAQAIASAAKIEKVNAVFRMRPPALPRTGSQTLIIQGCDRTAPPGSRASRIGSPRFRGANQRLPLGNYSFPGNETRQLRTWLQ